MSGIYERYNYSPSRRDEEDEEIESLRSKVSQLKEITIDINQEVTNQNRMFDRMNSDMDSLKQKLDKALHSVKELIKYGSNSQYFWYLIAIFVVFMFIIIFFRR